MKIKICNCGSGKESWWICDARFIPLTRVYRVDVLENPDYECNEEIEED